jgi:3-oxoacyl-[acyl-carrier-protein] synthase-3
MQAAVSAIEYILPERVLSTEALSKEHPEWSVEALDKKSGIAERHIAAPDECASDLAIRATQKLFEGGSADPEAIDFIIFCTQSPDYFLPTTACLIQERLGLPVSCGALDVNLGSSGYIYGLGLAQGLIASGQALNILLLTGETYSKYLRPDDRAVRTIFGDAGTATLLTAVDSKAPLIGPFVYGTDGKGGPKLIVSAGAARQPDGEPRLFMDGVEIFNFTIAVVPKTVEELLKKSGLTIDDVDLIVPHQANQFILEHLRNRMKIPREKFHISMTHGNTCSCSIPIGLKESVTLGRVSKTTIIALIGFGPGYSWGGTLLRGFEHL